jgi:hypothetical protein
VTITEATRDYEAWLAHIVPYRLVPDDLAYKHRLMAKPFPFFRGTYYRWAQRWAEAAGPLATAPRVLAVGDLHVENYGTWRDAEGRLCWGVNDFDEAAELPYTHDLVRLTAGVRFARKAGEVDARTGDAAAAILEGYHAAVKAGGRPFVLEEHNSHLRALALAAHGDPDDFWDEMEDKERNPPEAPPVDAREALEANLPRGVECVEYRARPKAGVGSLGRPRYVALACRAGSRLCREAKAAAPPATAWASGADTPTRAAEAVGGARRSPDPFYHPGERWVVRRLGPKTDRIDLGSLRGAKVGRVLRAMGAEAGNVHVGTPGAAEAILAHLDARPADWLAVAARRLADLMEEDWDAWKAGR